MGIPHVTFATHLTIGSLDMHDAAAGLYETFAREIMEADPDDRIGFTIDGLDTKPASIRIADDGSRGNPDYVIEYVLRCAHTMDLGGFWGFAWGLWGSSTDMDSGAGAAVMIDLAARKVTARVDLDAWVAITRQRLDPSAMPLPVEDFSPITSLPQRISTIGHDLVDRLASQALPDLIATRMAVRSEDPQATALFTHGDDGRAYRMTLSIVPVDDETPP